MLTIVSGIAMCGGFVTIRLRAEGSSDVSGQGMADVFWRRGQGVEDEWRVVVQRDGHWLVRTTACYLVAAVGSLLVFAGAIGPGETWVAELSFQYLAPLCALLSVASAWMGVRRRGVPALSLSDTHLRVQPYDQVRPYVDSRDIPRSGLLHVDATRIGPYTLFKFDSTNDKTRRLLVSESQMLGVDRDGLVSGLRPWARGDEFGSGWDTTGG